MHILHFIVCESVEVNDTDTGTTLNIRRPFDGWVEEDLPDSFNVGIYILLNEVETKLDNAVLSLLSPSGKKKVLGVWEDLAPHRLGEVLLVANNVTLQVEELGCYELLLEIGNWSGRRPFRVLSKQEVE